MTEQKDISCTPRAANRRAEWLVGVLLGIGAAVFVLSFFFSEYAGMLQLVSLFVIVYALYVASRFLFVSNTYSLYTNERGERYFLIEQKQGKRPSLVCHLPLCRIRAIVPYTEAKAQTRGHYHTYVATMHGGDYQMLVVEGERGMVSIKMEADRDFVVALRAALAEKKAPSVTEPGEE